MIWSIDDEEPIKGRFVATTMAVSCSGWCGMRLAPSPPPLIMNHFSLESGAKPPDPAKGGKAVRRPRTVSEPKWPREEQTSGRGEIIPSFSPFLIASTHPHFKERGRPKKGTLADLLLINK